MDRHGTRVRQLASTPLRTFELLISKWEQNNEPPPVPSEPQDNSALRRTGSAMGGGPGSGVLPASSNGPTSKYVLDLHIDILHNTRLYLRIADILDRSTGQ